MNWEKGQRWWEPQRWVTEMVLIIFPETSEERIVSRSVDCGSSYGGIMGPTICFYKIHLSGVTKGNFALQFIARTTGLATTLLGWNMYSKNRFLYKKAKEHSTVCKETHTYLFASPFFGYCIPVYRYFLTYNISDKRLLPLFYIWASGTVIVFPSLCWWKE